MDNKLLLNMKNASRLQLPTPNALYHVLHYHDNAITRSAVNKQLNSVELKPGQDKYITAAKNLGFAAFPCVEKCDLERLVSWLPKNPLIASRLDCPDWSFIITSVQGDGVLLYDPFLRHLKQQMALSLGKVYEWVPSDFGVYIIAGKNIK